MPLSQESVEAGCPCAAAAAVTTAEASRPRLGMGMGMAALVAMVSEGECCGLLLARSDTLCGAHGHTGRGGWSRRK